MCSVSRVRVRVQGRARVRRRGQAGRVGLSESGAQLVGGATSWIRRRHGDSRRGFIRDVLIGIPREGRGEVRGSPRGLLGRVREHSRCDHWRSQSSHRLVGVVPGGTIPAQTPAL